MKKKTIEPYPRIKQIGLEVNKGVVNWDSLKIKLDELSFTDKFHKYFGIQTCTEGGPWASDVEDVLERLMSGKLTGTQHPLLWD